jgi:hypothetical protein
MVSINTLQTLTATLVLLGCLLRPALSEDLTLPPEFRSVTPTLETRATETQPAQKMNASQAKKDKQVKKKNTKEETSETSKPVNGAPIASGQQVVAPSLKSQDDPVSFGMKWNADTLPSGASPSDLFTDYNRNVQGQTTGTGGQVGMKYKF